MLCRRARRSGGPITSEGNENSRIAQLRRSRFCRSRRGVPLFCGRFYADRSGGRRGGERPRRVADDAPQRLLGPAQGTSRMRRAHRSVRRARNRRGDECPRRTGAAAVPDVARLLFPEDRALGAETHPLVRTARGGLRRPRTADRRGDRDGRLVHSGRSDGPCRRGFPHGASRARTARSLLV